MLKCVLQTQISSAPPKGCGACEAAVSHAPQTRSKRTYAATSSVTKHHFKGPAGLARRADLNASGLHFISEGSTKLQDQKLFTSCIYSSVIDVST